MEDRPGAYLELRVVALPGCTTAHAVENAKIDSKWKLIAQHCALRLFRSTDACRGNWASWLS